MDVTKCRGEGSSSMAKMVVEDERNICNEEGGVSIKPKGEENELYRQLWLKCAGPLATIPRVGDKVFYFPQGHIEQVEACTKKDIDVEMPIYNLPYKVLCEVVYVQLEAEPITDEVFAQITLLPEKEESTSEEESSLSLPVTSDARCFTKKLTPSDTSTHGGFSIPKRPADECFPDLDMSQDPPAEELVAKDLHGVEWHFRHVYRGHPKRHLLTTGWSTFVSAKKIVAGDTCVFIRGTNGDLYVGVYRAKRQQNKASSSVLSSQSMKHGILSSVFHAISSGAMFNVYYRPWTSPAKFIIPYNRCMEAAEIEYEVGTRFNMQFERKGEDFRGPRCPRFLGIITGIEDIDHIRWPCSEWRCLKVKLEVDSETLVLPERVSPWSIELIEISKRKKRPIQSNSKRLRPFHPSIPFIVNNDLLKNLDELTSPRHTGVLQGQEIRNEDVIAGESTRQSQSNLTLQPNAERGQVQVRLENKDHQHHDSDKHPGTDELLPNGKASSLMFANTRSSTISSDENHNTFGACSMLPVQNVNSLNYEYQEKGVTEALGSQSDDIGKFLLFGVNILDSHSDLPSPQCDGGGDRNHSNALPPPVSQLSISKAIPAQENSKKFSKSLLENQCRNGCLLARRSCTKVMKYGTALGRTVELSRFNSYDELIRQLDEMFDFNGTLIDRSCGWQVTYKDGEGDMMLLGDYPWQEFPAMVRKMFICPKHALDHMNAGAPNPLPTNISP